MKHITEYSAEGPSENNGISLRSEELETGKSEQGIRRFLSQEIPRCASDNALTPRMAFNGELEHLGVGRLHALMALIAPFAIELLLCLLIELKLKRQCLWPAPAWGYMFILWTLRFFIYKEKMPFLTGRIQRMAALLFLQCVSWSFVLAYVGWKIVIHCQVVDAEEGVRHIWPRQQNGGLDVPTNSTGAPPAFVVEVTDIMCTGGLLAHYDGLSVVNTLCALCSAIPLVLIVQVYKWVPLIMAEQLTIEHLENSRQWIDDQLELKWTVLDLMDCICFFQLLLEPHVFQYSQKVSGVWCWILTSFLVGTVSSTCWAIDMLVHANPKDRSNWWAALCSLALVEVPFALTRTSIAFAFRCGYLSDVMLVKNICFGFRDLLQLFGKEDLRATVDGKLQAYQAGFGMGEQEAGRKDEVMLQLQQKMKQREMELQDKDDVMLQLQQEMRERETQLQELKGRRDVCGRCPVM